MTTFEVQIWSNISMTMLQGQKVLKKVHGLTKLGVWTTSPWMARWQLNCNQVSPNASTCITSPHTDNLMVTACMLELKFYPAGEDKCHHLVKQRFLSFPLGSFFLEFNNPFFDFFLWQSKAYHGREECHAHVYPRNRLPVPSLVGGLVYIRTRLLLM